MQHERADGSNLKKKQEKRKIVIDKFRDLCYHIKVVKAMMHMGEWWNW